MRIGSGTIDLLGAGGASQRPAVDIARLANRQTASRLGIVETELPGGYRPIYSSGTRSVSEDVYETKTLTRKEDVFVDRALTEERDVYSTRDIYETQDVYETRPVYEEREVYQSEVNVDGSRDLRPFNSTAAAGIDAGSDLRCRSETTPRRSSASTRRPASR